MPGESFVESTVREVYEETGLTVSKLELCGIKQFQLEQFQLKLDEQPSRYVVFLYKTSDFTGTFRSSSEGDVFFINRKELCNCELADGFSDMLALFESYAASELCYYKHGSSFSKKYF